MNKKHICFGCTTLALYLFGCINALAQTETMDSLINVSFGQQAKEDVVHAISQVNVAELTKKSVNNTSSLDGIASYVGGYNGNIWGQEALILVDGVARDASLEIGRAHV